MLFWKNSAARKRALVSFPGHTRANCSPWAGSTATQVPYLEVVVQDPGILYCSVSFVTKHCHVQEGLAAHAVNRKTVKSQHSCLVPLYQQWPHQAVPAASSLSDKPSSGSPLLLNLRRVRFCEKEEGLCFKETGAQPFWTPGAEWALNQQQQQLCSDTAAVTQPKRGQANHILLPGVKAFTCSPVTNRSNFGACTFHAWSLVIS